MAQDLTPTNRGIEDLFGAPPLISGEDAQAYHALLDRTRKILKSSDVIGEMCVRDVVDLEIEILRYRRLKADLIQASQYEGLAHVLTPLLEGAAYAQELAWKWVKKEPEAIAEVERLLAAASISMDAVMAESFAIRVRELERIDHMQASAEARRADAMHELARHNKELAAAVNAALKDAEDAEFEDVDRTHAASKKGRT
jgi:hypothetical protein